jgi:hypothetical protein
MDALLVAGTYIQLLACDHEHMQVYSKKSWAPGELMLSSSSLHCALLPSFLKNTKSCNDLSFSAQSCSVEYVWLLTSPDYAKFHKF